MRRGILLLVSLLGCYGLISSQQKRIHLDAGPGQRPFDVTQHSVPLEEIIGGGPPRDGIPALDHPKHVTAQEANRFLNPWDRVLGVVFDGVAKAYPIRILNWHEIVNDEVGGRPITVTW